VAIPTVPDPVYHTTFAGSGAFSRISIRPRNLARLVGRSLAVSVGLLIYFASLGPLPVARAYRVGTPAMVAVFEYSFLIFASLWLFVLGYVNECACLGRDHRNFCLGHSDDHDIQRKR